MGEDEVLLLVMLGTIKPNLSNYPFGIELEVLRKSMAKDQEAIIK
ncbi:hypothetical protein [Sporosarcina sp. P3]|nr:hypothetical protein [Sporosarcina sp. P3]